MASKLLLKNGTALLHDENDGVEAVKTDILIEGNKITEIGLDISSLDAEIVDCTDKIISPGFVDTHHHVWQTQIRGRHANHTLLQYFAPGNFVSSLYSAEDMFWGQLGGCLEMLDCGTTTVVDYAHLNYCPDNNYKAISATASSGIRSIFCYCPNPRLTSWDPFTVDQNGLGGHAMPLLEELGKSAPFGNSRVTLGFAFDGFQFLPQEYLTSLMNKLTALHIPLIQFHYTPGPLMGQNSIPAHLDASGFLDDRFLIAHSSGIGPSDVALYRKRGVHISSTPSSELQMAMGFPVPAYDDTLDMHDLCSLGVDCHSATSSYIPYEARLALQSARAARGQNLRNHNKMHKTVGPTALEAFNQATIRGARAAKLGDSIGSIAVGKFADLVIFDALSPSMICGSAHDPVGTIILNSSPADVSAVIVDGVLRKENGKLKAVELDEVGQSVVGDGKTKLDWRNAAKRIEESRKALDAKVEEIDMASKEADIMKMWHINEANISDTI